MPCRNPLAHGPHEYLADSDAITLTPCPGYDADAAADTVAPAYMQVRVLVDRLRELDRRIDQHHERIDLLEGERKKVKKELRRQRRRARATDGDW